MLQEETGITNTVDPLAGSYYVESLTASMIAEAAKLIDEVEALGGMTKAVASGMPKLRIEESAARRQARIDRGEEVIVGVNKYKPQVVDEIDILDIDNTAVRKAQIKRLEKIRKTRDAAAHRAALDALGQTAKSGEGNLLERAVACAHARATVGEISDAMEAHFTRHKAEIRSITGVYGDAYRNDEAFARIRSDVEAFATEQGRRPRMLVVKLGQDGHDRGAKVIATAFADIGFDVDVGPLFSTPAGSRAPGHRGRRPRHRRQQPGRRAQDPGAGTDRGPARRGRRGDPGRRRRRHPATGLRHAESGGRGRDLRAGHEYPGGGARGAGAGPEGKGGGVRGTHRDN